MHPGAACHSRAYIQTVKREIAAGPPKGKRPPAESLDPTAATQPVAIYSNGIEPPVLLGHDVLVPANIKDQFHEWEKELLGASMVNVHSKVIVIDPPSERNLHYGTHSIIAGLAHK
jgi:hypothetical protein